MANHVISTNIDTSRGPVEFGKLERAEIKKRIEEYDPAKHLDPLSSEIDVDTILSNIKNGTWDYKTNSYVTVNITKEDLRNEVYNVDT